MERIMAVLSFVSNVVENNFDRSLRTPPTVPGFLPIQGNREINIFSSSQVSYGF